MNLVDRRGFLRGAAAWLLAAPRATHAQREGNPRRIGYLSLRRGPGAPDDAFLQGMRDHGYVEGQNLLVEYRWAAEREDRLPDLARELVSLDVEVLVTSATPAVSAATRATSAIPIVMQSAADPIGSGFITNLARPGGNVTGLTLLSGELAGKRLQLMQELVPPSARVAVLALDNAFATPLLLEAMQSAARQLDVDLVVQLVANAEDLSKCFMAFKRAGAQSLIVQQSPFTAGQREKILQLAARHRLPAMYESSLFVNAGGLVAYGPDLVQMFRRSAAFVDKILRGAKAGDLPIEQPTKFELIINLKTAKALGIAIPPSMLLRADTVIQ